MNVSIGRLALLLGLLGAAAPGWAGQHQNGFAYRDWAHDVTAVHVQQPFAVQVVEDDNFFALTGVFATTSGYYAGLQQLAGGDRIALFSIWDATEATGSDCEVFFGEGVGYHCKISYDFIEDRAYKLTIRRATISAAGDWWEASIRDDVTGVSTTIGTIRATAGAGKIETANNFLEYFGPQVPCDEVPWTKATFVTPVFNGTEPGAFKKTLIGDCSAGRVSDTIYGSSVVELGLFQSCGLGPELALLLPALAWASRRSRAAAGAAPAHR